jgi:hypothetical protein
MWEARWNQNGTLLSMQSATNDCLIGIKFAESLVNTVHVPDMIFHKNQG